MATYKKSGIYSPISLDAIGTIAKLPQRNPRLLIAYIVLARFSGQAPIGAFGANTVTGAGATAVAKILKIQWSRANELVKALVREHIIAVAPKGIVVGRSQAKYVMNFVGNVDIPHALVDGLTGVSGIARLLDEQYEQSQEIVFTAVIALMHCYHLHNMELWGGVTQKALHEDWFTHSAVLGSGFEVKAERGRNSGRRFTTIFFDLLMISLGVKVSEYKKWEPILHAALKLLGDTGLIYEAVTLVDKQFTPLLPMRINDMYAAQSDSEPSYIEEIQGAGYYTRKDNPAGDPEGIRFILPKVFIDEQCSLVGLTRLRFRCASPETAKGLARDAANINKLKDCLIRDDLIDDLA